LSGGSSGGDLRLEAFPGVVGGNVASLEKRGGEGPGCEVCEFEVSRDRRPGLGHHHLPEIRQGEWSLELCRKGVVVALDPALTALLARCCGAGSTVAVHDEHDS